MIGIVFDGISTPYGLFNAEIWFSKKSKKKKKKETKLNEPIMTRKSVPDKNDGKRQNIIAARKALKLLEENFTKSLNLGKTLKTELNKHRLNADTFNLLNKLIDFYCNVHYKIIKICLIKTC